MKSSLLLIGKLILVIAAYRIVDRLFGLSGSRFELAFVSAWALASAFVFALTFFNRSLNEDSHGTSEQRAKRPVRPDDVDDDTWAQLVAKHLDVEIIDLGKVEFDPSVVSILPAQVARKYGVIPVAKQGTEVVLAVANPPGMFALDDIKFSAGGYDLKMAVATQSQIDEFVSLIYLPAEAISDPWVPKDVGSKPPPRRDSSRAARLKEFLKSPPDPEPES